MTTSTYIYSIDEIKRLLIPIFEERGINKAILFGSYAKGEADESSDVDILAQVDDDMDIFYLASTSGLVEDALEKKIDFLYGGDVFSEDIENAIYKEGVVLYEKNGFTDNRKSQVLLFRNK